ncbi:T3SS effector HopA1 family protein [Nonomuraea sp. NPDC055795]
MRRGDHLAAVIYLSRDAFPALAEPMLALRAEIGGFLSPRTPVFTAELAPGLGLAEDPATGESFGEHRCRLLAEAMARAEESGTSDVPAAIDEYFARAGVDLDAAHPSPRPAAGLATGVMTGELGAALAIGERLTAEAIWSGERCNWVGAEPVNLLNGLGPVTYRALCPDLYGSRAWRCSSPRSPRSLARRAAGAGCAPPPLGLPERARGAAAGHSRGDGEQAHLRGHPVAARGRRPAPPEAGRGGGLGLPRGPGPLPGPGSVLEVRLIGYAVTDPLETCPASAAPGFRAWSYSKAASGC